MQLTGVVGAVTSLLAAIITFLGTVITIRVRQSNRKYRLTQERNKRHREIEEKLIQASDWIFEARYRGARKGFLHDLPDLPQILHIDYVQGRAEEEPDEGPYTNLAQALERLGGEISDLDRKKPGERRHEQRPE